MKYSHIVTEEEIQSHPEVFVEGIKANDHVLLGANDLAVLGITKHVLTEDDFVNNENLSGKVGDEIDVEKADAVSTLDLEKAEQEKKEEAEKADQE